MLRFAKIAKVDGSMDTMIEEDRFYFLIGAWAIKEPPAYRVRQRIYREQVRFARDNKGSVGP